MTDLIVSRKKLAILWGVSFLLLYGIVFAQTLGNKHDGHINDVWGWLLQSTIPILSLIFGLMTFDTFNRNAGSAPVNRFTFYFAFISSLVYLALLMSIILFQPASGKTLWELVDGTNIFLAPVQGFVIAVVGLFFAKKPAIATT